MSLLNEIKIINQQPTNQFKSNKSKWMLLNTVYDFNKTNAALLISFENYQFKTTIKSNIVTRHTKPSGFTEFFIDTNDPILKDKLQLKLKTSAIRVMDINLIHDSRLHLELTMNWMKSIAKIWSECHPVLHGRKRNNDPIIKGLLTKYDKFEEISELFQDEKIEYYNNIIKKIKKRTYNYDDPNIAQSIISIIRDTVNIMFDKLEEKTNIRFTRYLSDEEIKEFYD